MAFQPGSTAGQLGLNEGELNQIINATMDASGKMANLNAQVGSLAIVINQNMNSDAGRIMEGKLTTWTDDFNRIKASLDQLNGRSVDMRNALIAANTGAGQTAASSQV